MKTLALVVSEEYEEMAIKSFLRKEKNISTRLMSAIKYRGGRLEKNGREAKFVERVSAGDLVEIFFPDEESHFEPENIPISIIYEDEHLALINKQAGIIIHPTKGHPTGTLSNALTAHMFSCGERYKVRFANRLDMDTTGIVLACKNAFVQDNFVKQGERVEKVYEALVRGEIKKNHGRISLPITKNGDGDPRREVNGSGREATTEYEVIKRFTAPAAHVSAASDATATFVDESLTHIRLFLRTGRTHQLRVHLAHIGHPVLGDSLYGVASALISRQALHAKTLRFTHPVSGKEMKVEAALPEDMAKILI